MTLIYGGLQRHSKNQIKWKPDIFFKKRKLHYLFFESLCSEIGKKLH